MLIVILYGVLLVFIDIMTQSETYVDIEALYYTHPTCADSENLLPDRNKSGRRIIGGTEAPIEDFPFAVSLQTTAREHKCGGSLIKPKWILTAAHCLLFTRDISLPVKDAKNYLAVMGTADARKDKESINCQIRGLIRFIPHKKFNHQYMQNDIGLIEVENKFVINKFVDTATLPFIVTNLIKDDMCTAVGWGYTDDPGVYQEYEDNASLATSLQEVEVPVIETTMCQHYYSSDTIREKINMCAGYHIGLKDACSGDSGGPLLCKDRLVAIISWGFRCAYPESPGVYTRVDHYLQWINRTTKIIGSKNRLPHTTSMCCLLGINFTWIYIILIQFILI